MMRFQASMFVVEDIARARAFYTGLLDCKVTLDFGANITLDDRFSLQERAWWVNSIQKTEADIRYGGNDAELYFEESDFDAFLQKLEAWDGIKYLLPLHEAPWGQRAVQFYDPDGHIVEVGEHMGAVVRRFLAQGMTIPEVAKRMDIPEPYAAVLEHEYFT